MSDHGHYLTRARQTLLDKAKSGVPGVAIAPALAQPAGVSQGPRPGPSGVGNASTKSEFLDGQKPL